MNKALPNNGNKLRVPCCYQGGKQRVAPEIVDRILSEAIQVDENTVFYDLCCGSGAYSLELINRGIRPNNIIMLDKSSWGTFWQAIGSGSFSMEEFGDLLERIPADKKLIKQFMLDLSAERINGTECYTYLVLQACSFGGKQIWRDGNTWKNAFFRDYWEPTATSVRKSPANPMQPSPKTLEARVAKLVESCRGITCIHDDIEIMLQIDIPENAIIYIDPPYRNTTGYAYGFDLDAFVGDLRSVTRAPIFVSEGFPLNDDAYRLAFGGAKGGISGNRNGKHQEWLSRIE